MPRLPKDPDARQRRNKAVTAATLAAPDSPELKRVRVPPLTKEHLGIKVAVKPQARAAWQDYWHSPMAPRWINTDIHVLYICALLHHQIAVFASEGKSVATLAAELRQQEGRVGLDVLARRRLDWRIEGPRPSDQAPQSENAPLQDTAPADFDPRKVLRAVQ